MEYEWETRLWKSLKVDRGIKGRSGCCHINWATQIKTCLSFEQLSLIALGYKRLHPTEWYIHYLRGKIVKEVLVAQSYLTLRPHELYSPQSCLIFPWCPLWFHTHVEAQSSTKYADWWICMGCQEWLHRLLEMDLLHCIASDSWKAGGSRDCIFIWSLRSSPVTPAYSKWLFLSTFHSLCH